jgi:hypothetical protein
MKQILMLCGAILFFHTVLAQQGSTENLPGQESVPMTAQDSLKESLAKLKAAWADVNKLLVRKGDSMTIEVAGIDYDNSHLTQLKDGIKKLKNVRSLVMRYSGTTATMEIIFKGKPTDLWDNLPAATKSSFKVFELGDKNIKLDYKHN